MPDESRMHRLRVGDVVSFEDSSEWPPVHMEGPITGFANDECTYVVCNFGDEHGEKTLTEDEVRRVA